MHFFVEKFKICNFLSFFGEYEVNLKPFSAVMCNYSEGKKDFLEALAFVFGAQLNDMGIESPLKLIHKVVQEEFLINREIQVYVEVTLHKTGESKHLKFRKSIKKGLNGVHLEHKICDIITSFHAYKENLNFLNLHIKNKNLIFYKEYFSNCIWGSSEELEKTIVTCLRENYLLKDWKEAQKEVKLYFDQKNKTFEKNCSSIKRMHSVISKFTSNFESISSKRDKIKEEMLIKIIANEDEEDTLLSTSFLEETMTYDKAADIEQKFIEMTALEFQRVATEEKLHGLKLKKAEINANLYYEKIKLAADLNDTNIVENSIDELKILIQQNENFALKIEEKLNEMSSNLANLSKNISQTFLSLCDMRNNMYLENRFTVYGRFKDYFQPSRYVHLLKEIIGSDIFYANLCDSTSDALNAIEWIKTLKYEERESFIIFSNHSYQLKDILISSGEKGIEINQLEQLLIFLTKLMHIDIIDEVPILCLKPLNLDEDLPQAKDYFFYVENNLHLADGGLISYKAHENNVYTDTETELGKTLYLLQIEEEVKYQEFKDLIQVQNEIRNEISSLKNDILYFQNNYPNSSWSPPSLKEPPPLSEIYLEYSEFFIEENLRMANLETEYVHDDPIFRRVPDTSLSDETILQFAEDLLFVQKEKNEAEEYLRDLSKQLRLLHAVPSYTFKMPRCLIKFDTIDKSKLFFEKEFNDLKKLISDEDLEDFCGSKEWRASFISYLNRDLELVKKKFRDSSENYKSINTSRKTYLYPLIEHCSHYLSKTCNDLIDSALPLLELNFTQNEDILQLSSTLTEDRINLIDIKHFNTFFRFISVLALFLEIAKHTYIPLMVFEDLEDFIPKIANFSELCSENLLKQLPQDENLVYHFLMRLGQYLKSQINKNNRGNHIRTNENFADYIKGPMQIIYFAKGDFFHAADHYLWIHNQMLPDELVTEECDSFSRIEEIQCPYAQTSEDFCTF